MSLIFGTLTKTIHHFMLVEFLDILYFSVMNCEKVLRASPLHFLNLGQFLTKGFFVAPITDLTAISHTGNFFSHKLFA